MNGTSYRKGMGWGARLMIALVLIVAGAAAATWGLAHYQPAARLLGVTPPATATARGTAQPIIAAPAGEPSAIAAAPDPRIATIEARLEKVENATERAEGSAGRADALVIAFAARRAIDRGVALGYLENLLVGRFGTQHQQAVATIVTASRQPVLLNDLIAQFDTLGPELKRGGPTDNWWSNVRREFGSLVEVHSAERPSTTPNARFDRAMQRLQAGEVDQALAETMRLPGAGNAGAWIAKARRYIAAHRALDEIESAALLPDSSPAR